LKRTLALWTPPQRSSTCPARGPSWAGELWLRHRTLGRGAPWRANQKAAGAAVMAAGAAVMAAVAAAAVVAVAAALAARVGEPGVDARWNADRARSPAP
jgi:hypothetical protein